MMLERLMHLMGRETLQDRVRKEEILAQELGKHAGRYVRIVDSTVVASEDTLFELRNFAPEFEGSIDHYVVHQQDGDNFFLAA